MNVLQDNIETSHACVFSLDTAQETTYSGVVHCLLTYVCTFVMLPRHPAVYMYMIVSHALEFYMRVTIEC